MGNADQKIKVLNNKIMQWVEMQSKLLDLYLEGKIEKNEYKERYNNLDDDINNFKLEIHEALNDYN